VAALGGRDSVPRLVGGVVVTVIAAVSAGAGALVEFARSGASAVVAVVDGRGLGPGKAAPMGCAEAALPLGVSEGPAGWIRSPCLAGEVPVAQGSGSQALATICGKV